MRQTRPTRQARPTRQTRPTWAEIARGQILENWKQLQRLAGPETELLAVVKANAYGHGLSECAPLLAGAGARWLGVTCVEEGVALRAVCPDVRILIMSGLWPGEAEAALEHGLTPVVWEPAYLEWIEEAARGRGLAAGSVPVHLEIDTGMSRQGVRLRDLRPLLERFGLHTAVRLEAVMTHFHSPENAEATERQERVLEQAVTALVERGLRPELLSAGSSANVLQQDTAAVTQLAERIGARRMMRPGIALYGYAPQKQANAPVAPVLRWKTRVTGLREIEAGETAGYDATFRAQQRTRLALLPVGYADGLNRLLSNRGSVLVRGRYAPIAGRISMDQTLVDVTEIAGVAVGDEVVLIGTQEENSITAQEVAEWTGTICWEVLCAIGARVPRELVD